jgi:hypothetical protein
MKGRYLLLLLFTFSIIPLCFSQVSPGDDLLRELVQKNGQADVTVPFTNPENTAYISRNASVFKVDKKAVYISLSSLTVEWFISEKFDYTIIQRKSSWGVESAKSLAQAMQWDKYPTWSQYDSIMKSFVSRYPSICRIDTIGISNYGKLILALKISDNAAADEDEPEVFYSSTIHGDEPEGFVLMLRLCDYLLNNYSSSARFKNIVDNLEIWINPISNPDGAYRSGVTLTSPVRFNSKGYDLNRNFPDPLKPYSASNVQQTETHYMVDFLRRHRFVISANFHSGAEVVNFPWDRYKSGVWEKVHPDEDWFRQVSRAYADTVHRYGPAGYMTDLENGVTRGYLWYAVLGGRQDYVTWELQGREVTIELYDPGFAPASLLPLLWDYNHRSLTEYLENALYGVHGTVQNLKNMKPVAAKVFIKGHDADSSHVYSDTLTGSFVRLLSPGIWNISFSATGYKDTTYTNIAVYQYQKTDLQVKMIPEVNPADTIPVERALMFPNPASGEIWCFLSGRMAGRVSVKIFSSSGVQETSYENDAVDGYPFRIDISRLAAGTYTVVIMNRQKGLVSKGRIVVIK